MNLSLYMKFPVILNLKRLFTAMKCMLKKLICSDLMNRYSRHFFIISEPILNDCNSLKRIMHINLKRAFHWSEESHKILNSLSLVLAETTTIFFLIFWTLYISRSFSNHTRYIFLMARGRRFSVSWCCCDGITGTYQQCYCYQNKSTTS